MSEQDEGGGSDTDDSEDEAARANAEHAEIVDSFKIRSLRSAQFFAEQEKGGGSRFIRGRKCKKLLHFKFLRARVARVTIASF